MNARPEDFAARAFSREELEAFWMPFTANRQFKDKPRMLSHAKGMHYWTADGRPGGTRGGSCAYCLLQTSLRRPATWCEG